MKMPVANLEAGPKSAAVWRSKSSIPNRNLSAVRMAESQITFLPSIFLLRSSSFFLRPSSFALLTSLFVLLTSVFSAPTFAGSIIGLGSQVAGVDLSRGFITISAGMYHSLGLKQDGSIVGWGDNYYSQCNVPSPNSGFIAISAGEYHSLGLKQDGSIVAWGDNNAGQRSIPSPNSGFIAISAGGYHSLGLKQNGSIVAWGYNAYGQCNIPSPNTGFIAISAGGRHSLGLKQDGSIVGWGDNDYGQRNVPSPNTGFIAISAGGYHSLALKTEESPQLFLAKNLLLVLASPVSVGEFGVTTPGLDPMWGKIIPLDDVGNNIETPSGWETIWSETVFTDPKPLKGQWSRIGTKPGELTLFWIPIYENKWRERRLSTLSAGSFSTHGIEGSGTVPIKIKVEYDSEIRGVAVSESAASLANAIPQFLTLISKADPENLSPLLKAIGIEIGKKVTGIMKGEIVAVDSKFTASTGALMQVFQSEQQIGPDFTLGTDLVQDSNESINRVHNRSGEWTVSADPKQNVSFTLSLTTKASAYGTAEAYAGVRHYRLEFDIADREAPPLIIERWDPASQVSSAIYKQLLLAAAGTPELVTGGVEIRETIGVLSPPSNDKFVILSNTQPSGFLLPLTIESAHENLILGAGAIVSDPCLAHEALLEIVFIQKDKAYPVWKANLSDMFVCNRDSGIPEKPYGSVLTQINIDISTLPRGDGTFFVGFGDPQSSDLLASLVIDLLAPVSKRLMGDLDVDSNIDLTDLAGLSLHWLEQDCNYPSWCEGADINYDRFVDLVDFSTLANNWLWKKVSADFNSDRQVDLGDLLILKNYWLDSDPTLDIAPSGGDGVVNFLDFAVFAEHWLEGTGP